MYIRTNVHHIFVHRLIDLFLFLVGEENKEHEEEPAWLKYEYVEPISCVEHGWMKCAQWLEITPPDKLTHLKERGWG